MSARTKTHSEVDARGDDVTEAPADAPLPKERPKRVLGIPDIAYTVTIGIALLSLAEIAGASGWISPLILPRPSAVWQSLVDGFSTGLYWRHIQSTLLSTMAGFGLASVSAIVIAGLLASVPWLERVFIPYIIAFQSLPKIAIAPLVILWLGFGESSKITIVALICFFPILINSLQGLKLRNREHFELLRSLGATRWQLFRFLRIPGSLPYVFAGLHIGVIFALIGAVVAEFVGSRAGLGYTLMQQKAVFNVPGVFALLVLLMIAGLLLNWIMTTLERKIAFWAEDVSVVSA